MKYDILTIRPILSHTHSTCHQIKIAIIMIWYCFAILLYIILSSSSSPPSSSIHTQHHKRNIYCLHFALYYYYFIFSYTYFCIPFTHFSGLILSGSIVANKFCTNMFSTFFVWSYRSNMFFFLYLLLLFLAIVHCRGL